MKYLISPMTIDSVRQLDIFEVCQQYYHADYKKSGGTYKALSPFKQERTPSFYVHTSKQFYKCFATGKSGGVIDFVMEVEGLEFLEAIKKLCQDFNVPLEYDNVSDEQLRKIEKKRSERKQAYELYRFACNFYRQQGVPYQFLLDREWTQEAVDHFQLGYAPPNPDSLYKALREHYDTQLMIDLGLVVEKASTDGRLYFVDRFRDRVIFPFFDAMGNVIGFTGRYYSVSRELPAGVPKYLHVNNNSLFERNQFIYNLFPAKTELNRIDKKKLSLQRLFLVEGTTDVISLWCKGCKTAIACLGSELSEPQAKQLSSYPVCLIPDNDKRDFLTLSKPAGHLLKNACNVYILIMPDHKDNPKLDPDEYCRDGLQTNEKVEEWLLHNYDIFIHYQNIILFTQEELSRHSTTDQKKFSIQTELKGKIQLLLETFISLIRSIPNKDKVNTERRHAEKALGKDFKELWKDKEEKGTENMRRGTEDLTPANKENYFNHNYWEENNCTYSINMRDGSKIEVANFVAQILYHVRHGDEGSAFYIIKLINESGIVNTEKMLTADFNSRSKLNETVGNFGCYRFMAGQFELDKWYKHKFKLVRPASTVKNIGWDEQLRAHIWTNGISLGKEFFPTNEHGIVTIKKPIKDLKSLEKMIAVRGSHHKMIELNGQEVFFKNYQDLTDQFSEGELLTAISKGECNNLQFIYMEFSIGRDQLGYKREHGQRGYHKLNVDSQLTWKSWVELLHASYKDHTSIMACFYIASLYRDFIHKAMGDAFPLLCMFGDSQAGKSTAARSLTKMFGEGALRDGLNLEGGATAVGVRRFLNDSSNMIVVINEIKNDMDKKIYGMIKALFDGSGRIMGEKSNNNKTHNLPPKASVILVGQEIPSRDKAVFNRCIGLPFKNDHKKFDIEAYNKLALHEKKGDTSLLTHHLLCYRELIEQHFDEYVSVVVKEIHQVISDRDLADLLGDSQRAIKNYATIFVPYLILQDKTDLYLPFTRPMLYDKMIRTLKNQVALMGSQDECRIFFETLPEAMRLGIFQKEIDWKIQKVDGVTRFCFRYDRAYNAFAQVLQKRGERGMDATNFRNYLNHHAALIPNDSKGGWKISYDKLRGQRPRSLVFDYDALLEMDYDIYHQDLDTTDMINERINVDSDILYWEQDESLLVKRFNHLFNSEDRIKAGVRYKVSDLHKLFNENVRPIIHPDKFYELCENYNRSTAGYRHWRIKLDKFKENGSIKFIKLTAPF